MQPWKIKVLSYLTGAWNYRWYGLAVAWVVCVLGWSAIAVIPDQYQAEAKVYIDTDTLMAPLLKSLTVTTDPAQQVAVMLRTLITRPNLEQVIRLTNPKASSLTPAQLEKRVEAMEEHVTIRPLEAKNLFAIGFTNDSASYAESVAQTLLSILVDSNIGDKRRDMEGARSFIDQKIAEYENMLREAERRRAEFKTANLDIIGKGNAGERLDAASTAADKTKEELSSAIARRDNLREQLAATPKTVASDMAFLNAAQGGSRDALHGSPMQRLGQAQQTLVELRARFTDEHPDVIATKKMIAHLQAEVAAGPGSADSNPGPGLPNPVYVELRTKLADEEMNVALQRHRVEQATADLAQAKEGTTKAIEVGTKYADLDRDYAVIEKNYQELLKSRESARLSQSLDDQRQTIAFRVVEPPQKSEYPAAPDRLLFNSFVLLLGIGGGVAAAVLLFLNAGRFVVSDEVTAQFAIPLIGVITRIRNAAEMREMKRSALVLGASVALLLFCYVGVLVALQTSVLPKIGA